MTDSESRQLLSDIINNAQEGIHFPFRPIVAWDEFRFVKMQARSIKLVIRTLKASAKSLFKEYCKDVIAGISDVTQLLAFSQLQDVTTFYETELNTVDRMLADYKEYLDDGNLLYALLGGDRFHDSF